MNIKKILKWIGISIGGFIVLMIVLAIVIPKQPSEEPPIQTETNQEETQVPAKETEEEPAPSVKKEQEQSAFLWGEENGEVVVPMINVWKYSPCEKPWPSPKYTGEWIITASPHKTDVTILEKTKKEGDVCYKIKLPDGKIGWVSSSLIKLK